MDHKLQELNLHIEALWGLALNKDEGLGFSIDPPLDAHIIQEPLLRQFEMLELKTYDESIDLIIIEEFQGLDAPPWNHW